MLLVKIRTLFNIGKRVKSSVQYARQPLIENFVPLYFGMKHVTITQIIENYTRPLGRRLFVTNEDNDTCLILMVLWHLFLEASTFISRNVRAIPFKNYLSRYTKEDLLLGLWCCSLLLVVFCMSFRSYFTNSKNSDAKYLHIY